MIRWCWILQEWAKTEVEEDHVAEEDADSNTHKYNREKKPTIKWTQMQQKEEIPSISNQVCNLKSFSGQNIG